MEKIITCNDRERDMSATERERESEWNRKRTERKKGREGMALLFQKILNFLLKNLI
jgi:hypothetical protein